MSNSQTRKSPNVTGHPSAISFSSVIDERFDLEPGRASASDRAFAMRLYGELAEWWPLVGDPATEYAVEAGIYADLRRAMETAWVHCRPGGAVLFAPDYVRENFPGALTDDGGCDEPRSPAPPVCARAASAMSSGSGIPTPGIRTTSSTTRSCCVIVTARRASSTTCRQYPKLQR